MPDKPYAERGARLRFRRIELQQAGKLLGTLATLAKQAGVSVSGFQQWERGETWPTHSKKAKLAQLMLWSEQELDFGPQPEAERQSDMASFHPVSNQELEVLALFRALEDQKAEAIRYLKAKVAARQAIGQAVRGPLKPVSDERVATHIPPARVKTKTR